MTTTLTVARTRLRSMLREPTANQWSDDRLSQLIQDSDWQTFEDMQRIRNSGYGQVIEEITLAADATTFSLTTGTPPTALTYNVEAIAWVEHQGPGGMWTLCPELQEADEYRLRAVSAIVGTSATPPAYRLRRPNIVFLPAASAARTLRVAYRPAPVALSTGATTLNCPDKRVPLVCARAQVFALADLGEVDDVVTASVELLKEEMYRDLENPNAEGRGNTVKFVESPSVFGF